MKTHLQKSKTAVALTAVFCIGIALTGCVTKRDIVEVKDSLSAIRAQNTETQRLVERMDSIITEGARSNSVMTNEIRTSVSSLQQDINRLLENYNDLMQKLDAMSRTRERVVVNPSPGAMGSEPRKQPTADCTALYDDAFVLVRASKYDQAIVGFRSFLDSCPGDEHVSNAHYWTGDCYYSQEKYTEAMKEFNFVIENFKSDPIVAKALYKLARSKEETGKKKEAKELYKKIISGYGGSLEAKQAQDRLNDLK